MSLIELMIAMFVLLVGIVGNITLVALATGGNGRSRQQSNSTAIAQMVTEKISSVKASTSPNLTITDCAGNSFTISTTAPGGSALTSSGDVDYTQAAVANYQMLYTDCASKACQLPMMSAGTFRSLRPIPSSSRFLRKGKVRRPTRDTSLCQ